MYYNNLNYIIKKPILKGGMRQHQVVSHHHAGSDSGSDWGDNKNEPEWGKTEKWESKKRDQPAVRQQQHQPQRSRVDSSGWDEPESLNAQNWNDTNKQQSNSKNLKVIIC